MRWILGAVINALLVFPLYALHCPDPTLYRVGAGIYDITGPAAEVGMMGYGMIAQKTAGISQRLWARAFVINAPCSDKRIVIVNADLGMIFQGVKQQVLQRLQKRYGEVYRDENVLLMATHTHSGPGGFATDEFYNLTTFGFKRKNFDTIVAGIVAAINRAHENVAPARIKLTHGPLTGISHNRSPTAYLLNPLEERVQYPEDVDTEMVLLRFERLNGKPFATLNWFPLHGVSLNNKNQLISGDNKGYAEYLLEKDFASDYGDKAFVAAFAQSNAGDVSPNPLGQEGGSGDEGWKLVEQAGLPQYLFAKHLLQQATVRVRGDIDYRHQFVAMGEVAVQSPYTDGTLRHTCPGAIGVSMLAGTQDGEGIGRQGVTCDTITTTLPRFLCEESLTPCQGVKPIALSTGSKWPYPWTPTILPLQMMVIGQVVIVAVPFELTTMTGRRLKAVVSSYFPEKTIVLASLANAYAGYVATNEEYQLQRYEAASTHFGPWTQAALSQEYASLANALVKELPVAPGPLPPNLYNQQVDWEPGIVFDAPPAGKKFGDIAKDVNLSYRAGETVQVVFWGGHPGNDFRIQDSFLAVQQLQEGVWHTIRYDRDSDTEYHWHRSGIASSLIEIDWHTSSLTTPGRYRIIHYGNAKELWSRKVVPYVGYSSIFTIR